MICSYCRKALECHGIPPSPYYCPDFKPIKRLKGFMEDEFRL